MSGVNFTFNLEPVSGASAKSPASESEAAVGAKYESAQRALPATHTTAMSVTNSPACDGAGCFVVHGDGPGVTTLSIGEEDGGAGDFISLPVVDGAEFLQPPTTSFASGGDYGVTTLAIGEEDGGSVGAAGEIGYSKTMASGGSVSQPAAAPDYLAYSEPMFSDGFEAVGVSETYGVMQPVYSPGDTRMAVSQPAIPTTPISKPTVQVAETAPMALPATATEITVLQPPVKPAAAASVGSPLPEIKPSALPGGIVDASPVPTPSPGFDSAATADFVSVGDYDSYLGSLESAGETVGSVANPAASTSISLDEAETGSSNSPPVEVINEASTPESATTTVPTASVETVPIAPTTTESPSPVYTLQETASDVATVPEMEPASVTLPGPAVADSVTTAPSPAVMTVPLSDESESIAIGGAGPLPTEKPAEGSLDAPRLSDEDFRITTLALGEEEAGGG